MRAFVRQHAALVALLVVGSIAAAIVYELTSGGKPRGFVKLDPRLNAVDLRGDHPRELWKHGEFECLGWRATYCCDPHGQRDYTRDVPCDQSPPRTSGYCEIRNRTSGETMRVMLSTCNSWRWWLVKNMTCNDAKQFTDFSVRAARYQHPPPMEHPSNTQMTTTDEPTKYKRGVAMIGYPKVIAGVYAIVRMLRAHGCALPVEVWVDPMEMRTTHSVLEQLVKKYNVIVRTILDPLATKFFTKPYALYHSYFDSVLFIDSDNIPAKDPTYLFDSPEFIKFGAMFWPDFWRPEPNTPFNVHEQSVMWSLLDMPFIDMFEQESGQLLVDRTRSKEALNKLMFYTQMPRLLTDWHLVYGDKDLFRLAWLNTSTPFYYVPHLPALGGPYSKEENFFCGISMIQRDPSGDIIFLHRNQAKLNGRRDQKVAITHLQKFIGGNGDATSLKKDLDKYRITCNIARLGQHNCFFIRPKTLDGDDTPYLIQDLAGTTYPQSEKQAIHFSIEGRHFLTPAEEEEIAALEREEFAKMKIEADSVIAKRHASATSDQIWRIVIIVGLCSIVLLYWQPIARCRRRGGSASTRSRSSTTSGMSQSTLPSTIRTRSSSSSSAVESSWRRKKSFNLSGEDQHIL